MSSIRPTGIAGFERQLGIVVQDRQIAVGAERPDVEPPDRLGDGDIGGRAIDRKTSSPV
jgi:hypothetical protein